MFDAVKLLQQDGVRYSTGNMQASESSDGDTEEFFSGIDFFKVYHEGGLGGDYSIINRRCAEVLAPSPLHIADYIQYIYCRSIAEKQTLLYLLGDQAEYWAPIIRVSDDIQVFQRDNTYIESVRIQREGVSFKIHPRIDLKKVAVHVRALSLSGGEVVVLPKMELSASPAPPSEYWIVSGDLEPSAYTIRIELEDCLAFEAIMSFDALPF